MKIIYNYRFYLLISLISLFIAGLLSMFRVDSSTESFALVAFIFFSIAVAVVAFEEFFYARPNALKKIKSLSRIWKK